jgi:tetrahydromethanopterin S-methyltransferase subunit G
MNEDASLPPEATKRRGLLSGRRGAPRSVAPADGTQTVIAAYQETIREQIEQGLRELQQTAKQLMHEIAAEVWRTAGGDKDDLQARLLAAISRDQALRSLLAHTDERFQALAVRTARIEDTLNLLSEGVRIAREELARGVEALQDVQSSPATNGVTEIRERLDQVTRQIAFAFETLAERDRAITETVRQRVREHGELVVNETTRITKALEAYVQHGVAAMGQLAGSVETQLERLASREDHVGAKLAEVAEGQIAAIEERLRAIGERIAQDTVTTKEAIAHLLDVTDERNRSFGELLELMHERVGLETRDLMTAIEGLDARLGGALQEGLDRKLRALAELIRSDSMALRDELVRTAATHDEAVARTLEERLNGVIQSLTSATGWMVEEITRRIREEVLATIERQDREHARMLDARFDDAVSTIDRNMVRMSDSLEGQLDRLVRTVGDRASEAASRAAEGAIRERLEEVATRLATAASLIERSQTQTEEAVVRAVDARIAALAKMVRSDNQSLARQIVADQEVSKQALRAMKELQASLPADVIETIQRRMDDLAESVAKSQEMLAQRIDRMAAKIGERYDNDIQIVIDRMGDAMHALASLGRGARPGGDRDRIELE